MGRRGQSGENIPLKADLHCHILPYVDDGAFDKEESLALLSEFVRQGVTTICCTPHLRKGMFETTDDEIIRQWKRLQQRAADSGLNVRLFLSREYHADSFLYERLNKGELITMGNTNTILVEFGSSHSFEEMKHAIGSLQKHGYSPLVAHVERYPAVEDDTEKVRQLIRLGAHIQCNAGSILGREGKKQQSWVKTLLKENLVHVVASDAHDMKYRSPEHEKAYQYLSRKFGASYAEKLMYDTPCKLLLGEEGE